MEDTFTESGAKKLIAKITAYWAKQGLKVHCEATQSRMKSNKSGWLEPLWIVRSDMINGLPRQKAFKKAA